MLASASQNIGIDSSLSQVENRLFQCQVDILHPI